MNTSTVKTQVMAEYQRKRQIALSKMPALLRLKIWAWKLRYALRIYERSKPVHDFKGTYFGWCFDECAEEGFWMEVEHAGGSIDEALKKSPFEAADEELENWTDDEGSA